MKSFVLVLSVAFAAAGASGASAAPVPCEQMLSDVKAAVASAKLSDADKAKVTDLQKKGIERCKADDDLHADQLFKQALAIMGK